MKSGSWDWNSDCPRRSSGGIHSRDRDWPSAAWVRSRKIVGTFSAKRMPSSSREIVAADLYRKTSQLFAVLLPIQSVGVMGDARTYENALVIRCVDTDDFMTADWTRLPYDVLARMSTRIINEVAGVNRVCYDISSKPPATIEWE